MHMCASECVLIFTQPSKTLILYSLPTLLVEKPFCSCQETSFLLNWLKAWMKRLERKETDFEPERS